MRYVFLDIDGVLNFVGTKEGYQNFIGIDENNLNHFAHFMQSSNEIEETRIVLSSSWRMGVNNKGEEMPGINKYLNERLASVGLSIYDETPMYEGFGVRGKEIMSWLIKHTDIQDSYVIIDDTLFPDFRSYGLLKNFVQTSCYASNGGFGWKHERKCLEILKRQDDEVEELNKLMEKNPLSIVSWSTKYRRYTDAALELITELKEL